MQNAECKMQNRRTKQEQRVLAHYALQEGGKALEEGLMQNAKLKISHTTPFLVRSCEMRRITKERPSG